MQRLYNELINRYSSINGINISVATDCSGIEAPLIALNMLGVNYKHVFSSEIDKNCVEFIYRNYGTDHKIYNNLKQRDNSKYKNKPIDLYIAGFPCQTFSSLGANNGFQDRIKGNVYFYVYDFIDQNRPNMFILENVRALKTHDKGRSFKIIMESLNELDEYDIYHDVLNTKDYGLPQSRNRIFIVGIKKSHGVKNFRFPSPTKTTVPLEQIIDTNNIGNEQIPVRYQSLLKEIISKYPHENFYDKNNLWTFNLDVSSIRWFRRGTQGTAPCIVTSVRHFIPALNRRITPEEALVLQGIPHKQLDIDFSDTTLQKFAGNTMSTNVILAILGELLHVVYAS